MVDCSCCYTIRRDVSLPFSFSFFPLSPLKPSSTFDYLGYLSLLADILVRGLS
jgi:hypothetical protein